MPASLPALLLAAAAAATSALPFSVTPFGRRHWEAHQARLHSAEGAALPPDQFFPQTLDHFDVLSGEERWQQRFWINASLWKGGDSPVVLYIEGEGAGSAGSVVRGEHVELAEDWGALIVSLEHRFYGASIPTADLSVQSLRLLSSHQSIADIASFYSEFLVPTFNLSAANKVVSFGGSYPGKSKSRVMAPCRLCCAQQD
jgi:hypothetical protein